MNPFFRIDFSISDSLKTVRKSVLIYETIILDITDTRYHHEIYLSDPRRCDVSRLKTVVRHPIRKAE